MLQLERFEAADEMFDDVADIYMDVVGVSGMGITQASDSARFNPGGPQYVIFYDDPDPIRTGRRDGSLPKFIRSRLDKIRIVLRPNTFEINDAHTLDETPMRPGASIGDARISAGTLGALLKSPGAGDHFITCGHVVKGNNDNNTDVYQSGRRDARDAMRAERLVGSVVNNAIDNEQAPEQNEDEAKPKKNDVAIVKVSPDFPIISQPHDSPRPSSTTPAIGMQSASGIGTDIILYIDILRALFDSGGQMSNVTQFAPSDMGRRLFSSGRTSGLIKADVGGRAFIQPKGLSFPVNGFFATRVKGGVKGDSGAVAVISRGQSMTVTDNGSFINVKSTDLDGPVEYVPGAIKQFDKFVNGDGGGFVVNGTKVKRKDGYNLISRLVARLRALGNLPVVVKSKAFNNPCINDGRRRKRRPTNVKEIILKSKKEVIEEPDIFEGLPEEANSDTTCCSFGAKPYVTVFGDVSKEDEFNLSINSAATIKFKYSITQQVLSAGFVRKGSCFRGVCEEELISGTVTLLRKTNLEISGELGKITLPVIGEIKAGGGSFTRKGSNAVEREFILPCKPT